MSRAGNWVDRVVASVGRDDRVPRAWLSRPHLRARTVGAPSTACAARPCSRSSSGTSIDSPSRAAWTRTRCRSCSGRSASRASVSTSSSCSRGCWSCTAGRRRALAPPTAAVPPSSSCAGAHGASCPRTGCRLIVLVPLVGASLLDHPKRLIAFATLNQYVKFWLPDKLNPVTWSLTTEWHFYLLVPLVAWLLTPDRALDGARRLPRAHGRVVAAHTVAAAFELRVRPARPVRGRGDRRTARARDAATTALVRFTRAPMVLPAAIAGLFALGTYHGATLGAREQLGDGRAAPPVVRAADRDRVAAAAHRVDAAATAGGTDTRVVRHHQLRPVPVALPDPRSGIAVDARVGSAPVSGRHAVGSSRPRAPRRCAAAQLSFVLVERPFSGRRNRHGPPERRRYTRPVAVPKIVGIETEYGVTLRGAPDPNPVVVVEPAHQRLRRAAPRRLGLRGRVARPRRARLRPRRVAAARGRDAPRQRGAHERRPLLRRPRAPRVLHARVQRPAAGRARTTRRGSGSSPARWTPPAACCRAGPGDRRLQEQQRRQGQLVRHATRTTSSTATCRSRCSCATCMPWFVTRQVFTGAGKVGAENGADAVDYQMSQRADFFEEEVGLETTLKRPIVNTRDEPHADPQKYRRLHVIVGDANLCEVATFLKVGTTAIVLAMVEDGFIDKDLVDREPGAVDAHGVARPVAAARPSTSPTSARAPRSNCSGSSCGSRGSTPTRPASKRAAATRSAAWCSTAGSRRSPRSNATRSSSTASSTGSRSGTCCGPTSTATASSWDDPKLELLAVQYHDVRPGRSLYERLVRAGKVERLVDEADVYEAMTEPPPTTRAYFRGRCLAQWADSVVAANWDSLVLDVGSDPLRRIPMMEPMRGSKKHVEQLFARGLDAPAARRAARGDVEEVTMPERERKQKPAPKEREEVVEDVPAPSEARREAEGRHRRSPGRNRLRARGQRRGVRQELRPKRWGMTDSARSVPTQALQSAAGAIKPLDDFYADPQGRDGTRPECKACNLRPRRAWYRANPRAGDRACRSAGSARIPSGYEAAHAGVRRAAARRRSRTARAT